MAGADHCNYNHNHVSETALLHFFRLHMLYVYCDTTSSFMVICRSGFIAPILLCHFNMSVRILRGSRPAGGVCAALLAEVLAADESA